VETLRKEGLHAKFLQLDVTNRKSIRNVRSKLSDRHGGIDLLVNNAGVSEECPELFPTPEEQMEAIMETNYFGTMAVYDTLKPIFNKGTRVVNVTSSAGLLSIVALWKTYNKEAALELKQRLGADDLGIIELNEIMWNYENTYRADNQGEYGWPVGGVSIKAPTPKAYVVSKLGVSALTRLQQKDFHVEQDIAVNHVHPGWTETDLSKKAEATNVRTLTPEEAAKTIIYASLLPPNTDVRGQLIWENGELVDWVNDTPTLPKLVMKEEYRQEYFATFNKQGTAHS